MTDDSHTAYEPHPTAAMDRQWKRVVQRRELEAMVDEYYAMEDRVAELERQCDRLRKAWSKYVEFMRGKYGIDFEWTCTHLAEIDAALQESGDE